MSQNEDNSTSYMEGKISSFWELISEHAIVIPIIQRDYAQGRENDVVRQIRSKFIKQLLDTLADKNAILELDFVYGSLEEQSHLPQNSSAEMAFTPLDGQQRLTTLFLLHWFLAIWNKDDYALFVKTVSGRFSYKTRTSSKDFCERLIDSCNREGLIKSISVNDTHPVSQFLKDAGWFHDAWIHDPTIKGMLVMLDAICKGFKLSGNAETAHFYFRRLVGQDDGQNQPPIRFNLLYLNQGKVQLSDELYIKMNSRGKPLTDFETFKARFEAFLRKETHVDAKDFSQSIDGAWADTFWKIRDNVRPKSQETKPFTRDNTDTMMMNLIKVTLASVYASMAKEKDDVLDVLFESEAAKASRQDLHLTFFRYSTELGVLNEIDGLQGLDKKLIKRLRTRNCKLGQAVLEAFRFIQDYYGKDGDLFKPDEVLLDSKSCIEKILFYGIDGPNDSKYASITYGDRLLFYGLSQYCIRNKKYILKSPKPISIDAALNRWIRFVRNMNESVEINDSDNMRKVLRCIDGILCGMKERGQDILQYLCSLKKSPDWSPFPQTQVREEILKAKLILADARWEAEISEADNTPEWPGRSGYLLDFSGITQVALKDIPALTQTKHGGYIDSFRSYRDKMSALLYSLSEIEVFKKDHLLERALLCKGLYFREESPGLYKMMNESVSGRTYSWRQMIQYNGVHGIEGELPCEDKPVYQDGETQLKALLDDFRFTVSSIPDSQGQPHPCIEESTIKKIINDTIPSISDWRRPMLEDSRIWDASEYHYFWLDNNDRARIPKKKTDASSRCEVWTYRMFLQLEDLFDKHNGEDGKKEIKNRFKYNKTSDPDGIKVPFNIGTQECYLYIHHDSVWHFTVKTDEGSHQEIEQLFPSEVAKVLRIEKGSSRTCSTREGALRLAILLHANIAKLQESFNQISYSPPHIP